ncbi:hypothetical protein BD410DRAFT_799892 [Rickenella mellea]|uniref:Uncharacterized protein n=1 Tax=Rickenella mellea TaxID=50990 RepID=A0A4Y7QI19_9AGAM|nr:hypothetical protein BD410DRAFT_799892 [Rickenella mellea]
MLGESLTSCQLDFDGSEICSLPWDFTGVLHALASTRTLTKLALNFDDVRSENIVTGMPITTIPNLATFHISFMRCYTSKLIRPLMFALRMPHVFVALALRTECREDFDELLDSILHGENPYPQLLDFKLSAYDNELIHANLVVFLVKKLPSLVNLFLERVEFDPDCSESQKDYLVLWAGVKLDFCDSLSESGKWEIFQTLKISNRRGLSLPYLKDLKARIDLLCKLLQEEYIRLQGHKEKALYKGIQGFECKDPNYIPPFKVISLHSQCIEASALLVTSLFTPGK